jgi:small-conductance mechanosensitive channel
MGFARFMSSTAGRLIRILAGIALILIGLLVVHGTLGMNFCVFAPLFGGPFLGKEVR